MRFAHSVKPLTRQNTPTQIVALACDSTDCAYIIGRREGGELTRRTVGTATCREALSRFLTLVDPRRGTAVITWDLPAAAINLGLWEAMDSGAAECEWLVAAPTTSIVQSRHTGAKCPARCGGKPDSNGHVEIAATRVLTWIDLSNYTRGDLELVERLGSVEKSDKRDASDDGLERSIPADTLQARAQLYLSAWLRLAQLCLLQRWGGMRHTVAATAWAAYRRRYLPRRLTRDGKPSSQWWNHDSPQALAIERQAYFGDEVLVNRRSRQSGPIWKVDVNSLYPWTLADPSQPAGLSEVVDSPALDTVAALARRACVIAHVRLSQSDRTYPVRIENRVAWASGTFTTALCGEELIHALKMGHVVTINRLCVYRTADLFGACIRDWYALRLSSNHANDPLGEWIKLLLVSLYGKSAQSATRWVEVTHCGRGKCQLPKQCLCPCERCEGPGGREWGGWSSVSTAASLMPSRGKDVGSATVAHYRAVAGRVQRQHRPTVNVDGAEIEEPSHDASIAIAACCTSRSRARMRALRESAGSRNWFYQGVDCLLVNKRGLAGVASQIGTGLGMLKLSGPYQECEILGPKCYRLDHQWTVAGLTCRPHQSPRGRVTQRRRRSLADSLQRGKPVAVVEEELDLRAYSPRVLASVGADGWVSPWHLTPDPETGELRRRRHRRSSNRVI